MENLSLILFVISCALHYGDSHLKNPWDIIIVDSYPPESVITSIPAGIYHVKATNKTANILYDANDVQYRYLGNKSSIFRTKFPTNTSMLTAQRLLLVFHGLDTFATIKLNGQLIGETTNMFTRYIYDIKEYLINNTIVDNVLTINFESSIKIAKKIYNKHSKNYIVYPECVPAAYNGECHVNHIRKMQASFGWDWGPAFPGSAIWRDVELIPIDQAVLIDQTIDIYKHKQSSWQVNVTVLLHVVSTTAKQNIGTLQVTLTTDKQKIINSTQIWINNGDKESLITVLLIVPELSVQRWWPNGYGQQVLYNLTTALITTRGTEKHSVRVGFRTIELVQEPLKKGLSFYFRINDIPIFAKGSNVIPIKSLPELTDNKTYVRELLSYAKDAHMNMLRVWGGGIYESNYFYDIADEFGIMIWQDFMFACAMYPTTLEFLNSVKMEIIQNVWRLKRHPSIVIWAGNNENEAALYGNWYGTGNAQVYKDDYIKLYVDVIKRQVEQLDPYRPFVVSSPSNGRWADENGWIGTDPYSSYYGDIHYYNYIANGWDINTYPRPRFSSEYGVQSLPSYYNLQPVTSNIDNLTIDSSFINHRQHLPLGNGIMKLLIRQNFKLPKANDLQLNFKNYIYLSQINQAQSLRVQSESYRQSRSSVNKAGEGNTMGALYWQLNDVWQAPSWSSIDTDGRWKMLHYYAKHFFAPIIISPHLSPSHVLTLFIISDELLARFNCHVELNVHRINTIAQPDIYTLRYDNITVVANSANELTTIKLDDILKNASCGDNYVVAKTQCIVELLLKDENGNEIAPPNYVYPAPPKDMILPSCGLNVTFARNDSKSYRITIESYCGPHLFVWFDLTDSQRGKLTENGFHILRGIKTIYYYPDISNYDSFDVKTFQLVTLGQIYATAQPINLMQCINCI